MKRGLAAGGSALLLSLALIACGDDAESEGKVGDADKDFSVAPDQSTCRADADAIDQPYADTFPTQWVFPPDTTAFGVEDRGDAGTIVTAVSSASFQEILDFLNHDEVDAGFAITEGETEEHDAEANWTSDGYRGRWSIRESASCAGETVIQVLALSQG